MTNSPSSPVCLLYELENSNPTNPNQSKFAADMSASALTPTHEEVQAKLKHHLWQKTRQVEVDSSNEEEPHFYKLRISVVRDGEGVGDCPSRTFVSLLSHDVHVPLYSLYAPVSRKYKIAILTRV